MTRILRAALAGSLMLAAVACNTSPLTQDQKRELLSARIEAVGREFLDVPTVTPEALAAMMERPGELVLVDVRTEEERAVSMLPGAITREEFEVRGGASSNQTAVAYCTIGVRSSRFAQEMATQGVRVLNLEGSILAWTHYGGPLEKNGEPTDSVHVYGPSWNLASEAYHSIW